MCELPDWDEWLPWSRKGYSFPRTDSTTTAPPSSSSDIAACGRRAIPMAEQPFTGMRLRPSRCLATSARLVSGDDDTTSGAAAAVVESRSHALPAIPGGP